MNKIKELNIYQAPLQGYTTSIYRQALFEEVGGVVKYFTPFMEVNKCVFTPDINSELSDRVILGDRLVPQFVLNNSDQVNVIVDNAKQLHLKEVNFNFGCPFPMLTRRQMGAGVLTFPERVEELLTTFYHNNYELSLSVKMRLGNEDENEFLKLISILNQFPLSEVIVHPRTGKQAYKGVPNWGFLSGVVSEIIHPVIANGDINSVSDWAELSRRFTSVKGLMLGRGLLANPLLALEIIHGNVSDVERKERVIRFHNSYQYLVEKRSLQWGAELTHYYNFWYYILSMSADGKRWLKRIKKTKNSKEYNDIVYNLFEQGYYKAN